jgi:GT2 family glycosyltransferase
MSDVDVIVLDIDGGDMLRACIESVRAQTTAVGDIVVFDNGSRVPVSLDGARVMRSEANVGFAEGVNRAYATTTAEFVALVNNDVILDRDWLAVVKRAMDADARLGAVQTVIRRNESTIDGAGIGISDGTIRQIGSGQPVGTSLSVAWGVSATAALFRRRALGDKVFDARFFAYYEDVELSARLHAAGWRTFVVPEVKATHRGSASAPVLGKKALRLRTRNRYWVARMHRGTGSVGALLAEDLKLFVRGRASIRGMIEGLCSRL